MEGVYMNTKRSKIPGFRSGETWKKVTASIYYLVVGVLVLRGIIGIFDLEAPNLFDRLYNAFSLFLIFLLLTIPYVITFDFAGIRSKFPFMKKPSTARIIAANIIIFLVFGAVISALDTYYPPYFVREVKEAESKKQAELTAQQEAKTKQKTEKEAKKEADRKAQAIAEEKASAAESLARQQQKENEEKKYLLDVSGIINNWPKVGQSV
jgi:hypothetical protein